MSQSFSLHTELSVQQNLVPHARLYHLPPAHAPGAVRSDTHPVQLLLRKQER